MPEVRLIDADALIRMICGNECGCTPEECGIEENEYDPAACNFRSYIAEMPTIEAKPVRHGRWDKSPTGNGFFVYCSECGAAADAFLANKYKGCPFCLSEIDGGADNGT